MVQSANVNVRVGANAQRLRKDAGLSQTELAVKMSEAGHPWHQQTVLRIEKGSRPLKLDEVLTLVELLDVPAELLWDEPVSVDSTARLLSADKALGRAWEALERAAYELEEHRAALKIALSLTPGAPARVRREAEALLTVDAEDVVRQAARRFRLDEESGGSRSTVDVWPREGSTELGINLDPAGAPREAAPSSSREGVS